MFSFDFYSEYYFLDKYYKLSFCQNVYLFEGNHGIIKLSIIPEFLSKIGFKSRFEIDFEFTDYKVIRKGFLYNFSYHRGISYNKYESELKLFLKFFKYISLRLRNFTGYLDKNVDGEKFRLSYAYTYRGNDGLGLSGGLRTQGVMVNNIELIILPFPKFRFTTSELIKIDNFRIIAFFDSGFLFNGKTNFKKLRFSRILGLGFRFNLNFLGLIPLTILGDFSFDLDKKGEFSYFLGLGDSF